MNRTVCCCISDHNKSFSCVLVSTNSKMMTSIANQFLLNESNSNVNKNLLLENTNDVIFSNFEPCCLTDSNNLSKLPWLKNSLVFFHLNISSLHKHFDELQELVPIFSTFPEILCLSEARLKKTYPKFGYTGLQLHL